MPPTLQDSAARALNGRRVLVVFCGFELGGAERQGLHLARHLQACGAEVLVWSVQEGDGLVRAVCRDAGIPVAAHRFRWPCRKRSLLRDGARFLAALRRVRADVILPYTAWPNVGCGLFWRLAGARACVWGQRNVHGLRGDAVERFAYRRVSAVVCNARHEVAYLQRTLGRAPVPVHVVPNGVALGAPQRPRADWRRAWALGDDAVAVTMVANFRAVKRHALLLQAWRLLLDMLPPGQPAPQLLLAGAPQDAYNESQQLAAALHLQPHVTFVGQVRDVAGLLAASDLGVLTSRDEGLPNAILEYMAAGLPVIATDTPGAREALGADGASAALVHDDAASLAARLRDAILNPGLRRMQGEQNRRRATEQFSLDAMCARTTEIIMDLLAARGPGVRS